MEILLNLENEWNGEVGYPEAMEPCCLIYDEDVATAIKGI